MDPPPIMHSIYNELKQLCVLGQLWVKLRLSRCFTAVPYSTSTYETTSAFVHRTAIIAWAADFECFLRFQTTHQLDDSHTHTVWVKTLMNLTIAGVQMDVHRPQIWYNRFWSIPNLEHHIAKLEATWPIEHPGVALACATVRVWISRKFAFVTSLLSYTLNRNTMLSQISESIIIWVWVKIRYPNN